jgi:hypothetical protein
VGVGHSPGVGRSICGATADPNYAARVRPPTVALSWTATPVSNLPRFATVNVDSRRQVQDGHATGPIVIGTGMHQVTVSGIWGAANLHTVAGACDATGQFHIKNGEHLTCSATTNINTRGLCEGTCKKQQHERCMAQPEPIPTVADPDARQRHQKQCQDNFAACLAHCKTL